MEVHNKIRFDIKSHQVLLLITSEQYRRDETKGETSMSTNEMRMSVLSESIAKAITGRTSAVEGAERKKGQFEDTMFAAGFRSGHTISPKGKESDLSLVTEECFEQIKAAVIEGFPANIRRLMLTPTKALDDASKDAKRKAQQRIGANMRDLRKALERREIEAGEIEPEEKASKSTVEKCMQLLINAANTARKDEAPEFDVVGFIQSIEQAACHLNQDGANKITPKD